MCDVHTPVSMTCVTSTFLSHLGPLTVLFHSVLIVDLKGLMQLLGKCWWRWGLSTLERLSSTLVVPTSGTAFAKLSCDRHLRRQHCPQWNLLMTLGQQKEDGPRQELFQLVMDRLANSSSLFIGPPGSKHINPLQRGNVMFTCGFHGHHWLVMVWNVHCHVHITFITGHTVAVCYVSRLRTRVYGSCPGTSGWAGTRDRSSE